MLVADLGQMEAAIDHMARFHGEVKDVLADVDRAMVALRATWHGEGSDSQAQAQAQWEEGADQMQLALEQLHQIADQARTNYADAVSKNLEMWG